MTHFVPFIKQVFLLFFITRCYYYINFFFIIGTDIEYTYSNQSVSFIIFNNIKFFDSNFHFKASLMCVHLFRRVSIIRKN